jgi:hypothetical protein
MKITVDLELQESELPNAAQVVVALQGVADQVNTRVVTDKTALGQVLRESIVKSNGEVATSELSRRLSQTALVQDCLEVFCGIMFSTDRVERNEPVTPYLVALSRVQEPHRGKARDEIVLKALTFLSATRRLDSARDAILPYAEVLAGLARVDLVPMKYAIATMIQMIRFDGTRCAGITCLGKLVEIGFDVVLERCDPQTLEQLRGALTTAQQDDTFLYDVEYITEPFGWSQSHQKFVHMSVVRSGVHHTLPIVALQYSGNPSSPSSREVVVTSSADGTIATWDAQGKLIESCVLARHYAAALDLTRQGRAMLVGGVGRSASTSPAVVFYAEEMGRWVEKGAVEPDGGRVITCVRSIRGGSHNSLLFCCGVHGSANTLCYYDATRQNVLRDYHEHSDIITCLYSPSDRDNLVFSGSRDCTVCLYDLRMPQPTGQQFAHHYSTVSSIDGFGDYVITGGLDKRIMVHDQRMLHAQNAVRDLDSAVLSLSVSPQFVCAVATLTGVHFVNLSQSGLPTCRAEPSTTQTPRYNSLCWNAPGTVLFAGGDTETLDLFAQS